MLGGTGLRRIAMQGRAGKAPKREMVIESPQQYKSLAEIEAEVDAGSQVIGVSLCRTIFLCKKKKEKPLNPVLLALWY